MGRPKQYDADLEARLISAAADAVVRDGVEALSLRTVARCAGTSTNAIYTMFGGRDGLVHAVRQAAMTGFAASQFAALERSRQGGCDPKAHLLDLGRDYRTWAIEHPSLYQVMFGAQAPAGADVDPRVRSCLSLVVGHLHESGRLRGVPELAATSIWASVHGMVSLEILLWRRHDPADIPLIDFGLLYDEHLAATVRAWVAGD